MTAVVAAIAPQQVYPRSLYESNDPFGHPRSQPKDMSRWELEDELFVTHSECIEAGLTAVRARQAELQAALRCGEILYRMKSFVAHGEWSNWLKTQTLARQVKLSERTAQEYIRLYSRWPEIEAVANARSIAVLSLTKRDALKLIAQSKDTKAKALQLRQELQTSKAARQAEVEAVEREHELNLRQSLPLEQLQQMSRDELQEELIVLNREESDRATLLSGDSLYETPAILMARKRTVLELLEDSKAEPEDATNRGFGEMFDQLNEVGLVEPSDNIHIVWISPDEHLGLHWMRANGCEDLWRRVLDDRAEAAIFGNQIEVEAKIVAAIQEDCDRLNWPYRLQRVREGEATATVNGCGAIAQTPRLAFISAYLNAMKTRSHPDAVDAIV